jgi:hypothetical protein
LGRNPWECEQSLHSQDVSPALATLGSNFVVAVEAIVLRR